MRHFIFLFLENLILSKKIGCKLDFYNPTDFQWGYVAKGISTGMFKLLVEKKVDILACSQYFSGRSLQVIINFGVEVEPFHHVLFTGIFTISRDFSFQPNGCSKSKGKAGQVLCTLLVVLNEVFEPCIDILTWLKNGFIDRSFYSLLRPFQYPIWIGICVLIIVFPFVLCSIAILEYQFSNHSLFWTNLGDSAWYVYGSFLGEGVTGTIDSEQAWGLRWKIEDNKLK